MVFEKCVFTQNSDCVSCSCVKGSVFGHEAHTTKCDVISVLYPAGIFGNTGIPNHDMTHDNVDMFRLQQPTVTTNACNASLDGNFFCGLIKFDKRNSLIQWLNKKPTKLKNKHLKWPKLTMIIKLHKIPISNLIKLPIRITWNKYNR